MLNIFPNVDKNMLYYILLILEGNLGVTGKVPVIWSGGSRVQALENLYQECKLRLRTIDPCDLALSWNLRMAEALVHRTYLLLLFVSLGFYLIQLASYTIIIIIFIPMSSIIIVINHINQPLKMIKNGNSLVFNFVKKR